MSDTAPGGDAAAESPLDRLRRLAKESSTAKAGTTSGSQPPVAEAAPVAEEAEPAPPVVDKPASEEPSPELQDLAGPVYDEPAFAGPAYLEPAFDEPTYDEPAYLEPAFDEPAFTEPASEQSVDEQPVDEEPAFAEPVFTEPVDEQPSAVSFAEPPPPAPVEAEPLPESAAVSVPDATPEPSDAPVADQATRPGPPATARRRRRAEKPALAADDATAAADPATVKPTAPGSAAASRSAASRRLRVLTGVLGLLVVIAAVGFVLAVLHQRSSAKPARDRAAATAAAIKVVSDTTTLDYRNLDDWLRRVQADSSDGENPGKGLRSEYASDKDNLAAVTATNKSVSVGSVVKSAYCNGYCATSQVAGDTAAALVYGSAKVTSTTSPAGATNLTGFTVKLIKQNGKWLATNVDEVGVSPTS